MSVTPTSLSAQQDLTIFVNDNCTGCVAVLQYVKTHNVSCKVINIDFESTQPPPHLMVFPALFSGSDRLLAYGEDIIRYFQRLKRDSVKSTA